jgi:type II secretory pathway predicted ATPase ExeA
MFSSTGPRRGFLGVLEAPDLLNRTGILVGQPTLSRQLRMGVFAALDQRIATRFQ